MRVLPTHVYATLLFKDTAGIGDTQVGHCIFKAKHVACKITITSLRCFFDLT